MNSTVADFTSHYYGSLVWMNTYWMGQPIYKCPLDLFLYQEILFRVKPDVIVECGTNIGGSALFLAHMCDLLGAGKVITIDIVEIARPQHERITYLLGDTISLEIINQVKQQISPEDVVLVILDSDHTEEHVFQELSLYNQLVTKGSYVIVEDTLVNGHPIMPAFGPGPMEAVQKFLLENDQFIIDNNQHKFFLTFNPKGYLLKVK